MLHNTNNKLHSNPALWTPTSNGHIMFMNNFLGMKPYIFSKIIPLYMNTPLIQTLYLVLVALIITVFNK